MTLMVVNHVVVLDGFTVVKEVSCDYFHIEVWLGIVGAKKEAWVAMDIGGGGGWLELRRWINAGFVKFHGGGCEESCEQYKIKLKERYQSLFRWERDQKW